MRRRKKAKWATFLGHWKSFFENYQKKGRKASSLQKEMSLMELCKNKKIVKILAFFVF